MIVPGQRGPVVPPRDGLGATTAGVLPAAREIGRRWSRSLDDHETNGAARCPSTLGLRLDGEAARTFRGERMLALAE
jgi:hypothetical protein